MTRYMGTETEYGITCPDNPQISPLVTSTHAVVAYAALRTQARTRWNYAEEAPLRDARGFDLQRYRSVPVVDANAIGVANVVTTNGARYYVDHGHPEYSSPEVSNAFDAMVYDAAGDLVLNDAAADIQQLWDEGISVLDQHDPCPPLKFYKNNVDGKGQSYGSHENYLLRRRTEYRRLTEALGRDRTRHQVSEVTSLGLVQMTRKRVGSGLVEVYGETCEHCDGHGLVVQDAPVAVRGGGSGGGRRSGRQSGKEGRQQGEAQAAPRSSGPSVAQIARAVHAAALKGDEEGLPEEQAAGGTDESAPQAPAAAAERATDDAAEGVAEQAPREQTRAEQPATAPKAAAEPASPAQATSGDAPAVTGRIGRRSAAPVESAPQAGVEESSSYVGAPVADAPVADAPEPAPAPARRSSRRRAASTGAAAPSVTVAPQPAPTTSVAGGAGVAEKSTINRRTPRRRVVAPQGDGAPPA